MAVINLGVGFGLSKLRTWARWTETVFSGLVFVLIILTFIGFLTFGIGVMTNGMTAVAAAYVIGSLIIGYVIYLLVSPKAAIVFSHGYQVIIKATPYIKYQTSGLVKGLLLLLLAFFLLGIVSFFFRSR